MPLSAHRTPRITVPLLDDNSVAVRGLNLDDFMQMVAWRYEDVSKIAELYAEHQQAVFSNKALTAILLQVANTFPGFVSEVISIAADEPDSRDVKLGTELQMSVMTAIVKLTIEEAGGLGNLFARLRDLGRNLAEAQAELRDKSKRPAPSNGSTGHGESM